MIALNILLMTAAAAGIVSLLARSIMTDRKSPRAAGIGPATAPLSRNLVMPRELRGHAARTHAPVARRRVADASIA